MKSNELLSKENNKLKGIRERDDAKTITVHKVEPMPNQVDSDSCDEDIP